MNWKERNNLINTILFKALKLRRKQKKVLVEPLSIYDFTEEVGLEVRFTDISSMEGMYVKEPKETIIISSLRPMGRQHYTCAHELGHHIFKHGMKIDNVLTNKKKYDVNEFVADCFAGFLLMPKLAIQNAIRVRGWNVSNLAPLQVYAISCFFGVGYSTLLTHMQKSLKIISYENYSNLIKIKPINIRKELIGSRTETNVIFVDNNWKGRTIDVQVGDYIIGCGFPLVFGKFLFEARVSGYLFQPH